MTGVYIIWKAKHHSLSSNHHHTFPLHSANASLSPCLSFKETNEINTLLSLNKWNKHSVIPEQKKCMTKENFLHSRRLHAFHLSYPTVDENIFLNLRALMKQKKPTCRAAFPTVLEDTIYLQSFQEIAFHIRLVYPSWCAPHCRHLAPHPQVFP